MKSFEVVIGAGRLRVEARATVTGRGINILLTGGESPHIGAVVMCIPRKSDTGHGISADCWVTPVAGHKDHLVAQPFAESVCKVTEQITVVTAGIHIDNAQGGELESIKHNCEQAARELVTRYLEQLSVEVTTNA